MRMQMNCCYLQHQVAATELCSLAGVDDESRFR